MLKQEEFSILDFGKQNDELWYDKFEKIEGGPMTQCLVLVYLLKKSELVSSEEARSFK